MSVNVHKRTIVNTVAALTDNSRTYTGEVIDKFLSEITDELAKDNRLEFRGFGIFEVVQRKKKKARNPKTQEEVIVPPQKTVKFKMGKEMRELF